jgi:pyrimidine oxygenase
VAQAELFRSGFDEEACFGMMRAYGFLDQEIGRENAFVQSARSGFMSARIIGSPQSVGDRMIEMLDHCDLDGMMLIFPDYLASMPVFAAEIMPRIRSAFPSQIMQLAHAS